MMETAKRFYTKVRPDGGRDHGCATCGHEWPVEKRFFRWPIRAKLVNPWRHRWRYRGPGGGWRGVLRYGLWDLRHAWYWRPRRWGWEWGSDRLWRRWFVRVYGWGLVRVCCGPREPQRGRDEVRCPSCGALFWSRPG